jgi:hypothetical protein
MVGVALVLVEEAVHRLFSELLLLVHPLQLLLWEKTSVGNVRIVQIKPFTVNDVRPNMKRRLAIIGMETVPIVKTVVT